MRTIISAYLILATALVACGKADNEAKPSPLLLMAGVHTQPSIASVALAPAPPKPPAADRSVPLANYLDLNVEPDALALTFLTLARSSVPVSDEDKLRRLSISYINEPDSFKKREIGQGELPRINAVLDTYRKNAYFRVPIASTQTQPLVFSLISMGPYDFSSKSFPLSKYGQNCWSTAFRNSQGSSLSIVPGDFPCKLVVEDELKARRIEQARSQSTLALRGNVYLFAPQANGSDVPAGIAHAHIELVDVQSSEMVAEFQL